jgi:hypothetical protein
LGNYSYYQFRDLIIFVGIDSSGLKATHASQYYAGREKLRRRKYLKLSLAADVLQQIICTIKIRRAPTRHDTIDFRPPIAKTSEILALSVVTGVGLIFSGM